jgi:hypothetical protein
MAYAVLCDLLIDQTDGLDAVLVARVDQVVAASNEEHDDEVEDSAEPVLMVMSINAYLRADAPKVPCLASVSENQPSPGRTVVGSWWVTNDLRSRGNVESLPGEGLWELGTHRTRGSWVLSGLDGQGAW